MLGVGFKKYMKWCGVAPRETRLSWDIFHHVQDSDHNIFRHSDEDEGKKKEYTAMAKEKDQQQQ